jgi:hypothetical protein
MHCANLMLACAAGVRAGAIVAVNDAVLKKLSNLESVTGTLLFVGHLHDLQ